MVYRGLFPPLRCLPALLLLIALTPSGSRAEGLKPFTAIYEVKMGKMAVGTMVRKLALSGNRRYEFSSEVTPTGIAALFQGGKIVETSEGAFVERRPRPDRYEYRQQGGKKDRSLTVELDWNDDVLTTRYKGRETRGALPPGLLDKLVYQLALMRDLGAADAKLDYSVADNDGVSVYALARRGEEAVETPHGTYRTQRIERVNGNSKRRTVLWCAPDLANLPVKIEHREKDGKVTTALLQRLE